MSAQEKFKELIDSYDYSYVILVANHMILHYTGIGVIELRTFWLQVSDIAEEYGMKQFNGE